MQPNNLLSTHSEQLCYYPVIPASSVIIKIMGRVSISILYCGWVWYSVLKKLVAYHVSVHNFRIAGYLMLAMSKISVYLYF